MQSDEGLKIALTGATLSMGFLTKQSILVVLLTFLACFVGSCGKRRTTGTASPTPPGQNVLASGQSTNWKIEVISAEAAWYEHNALLMKFRIEYLGPSGSVPAPSLVVRNNKWEKIPAERLILEKREGEIIANPETLARLSLGTTEPQKEPLTIQTGEKFQFGITYGDCCQTTGLTVLFADVAPISF